jgi:uncharacterized protein YmfQ (DUF2313 family)
MGLIADVYARLLKQLLPSGRLWNLEPDSNLSRLFLGIAQEFARIDVRADDLMGELDPRTAVELLPNWEVVLGLPEDGQTLGSTIAERQAAVARKFLAQGGSTPAYFIQLAALAGYVATITETGMPLHTWRMNVDLSRSPSGTQAVSAAFRTGASRTGERLRSWSVAELEAIINKAKPAHTVVLFAYS